jgi:hypothetical protein
MILPGIRAWRESSVKGLEPNRPAARPLTSLVGPACSSSESSPTVLVRRSGLPTTPAGGALRPVPVFGLSKHQGLVVTTKLGS